MSFPIILIPLKMQNFEKKSKALGITKLIIFIPTKGCCWSEDILVSVPFKLVVALFIKLLSVLFRLVVILFDKLLSIADIRDISNDPSFIIIGPKALLIILSLDLGKRKKTNDIISDKKYINIKKYWFLNSSIVNKRKSP